MSKVIVHIDLNAFFVRCEEIKDPTLVGKPVAIGHEGRAGIVSTCSYKAREYGVASGQPMFKAKELCPPLIIKPVDFRFYGALSATFINFVKRYTPIVETASIDECYADFTEAIKNVKDVVAYFKKFQADLYSETKLLCSIGIAPTKFLAKMGSDYQKPNGLTIIRKSQIKDILYPLSIDKMFGIGKKTAPRLKQEGILTIGDLAIAIENNQENVKVLLGKFITVADDWLHGRGNDTVEVMPSDPKSIGHSSTFKHDTDSYDEIKQMFERLSKEVSDRAKRENKIGNTVQIVVKEADFKTRNKSLTFENHTNDYNIIVKHALELYFSNFEGLLVRLVGVTLQNLISPEDMAIQMSLFDYEKHEDQSGTKLLINDLNRRLKKPALMRASEVKNNGNKRRN
jgi:DNA polymerase-4